MSLVWEDEINFIGDEYEKYGKWDDVSLWDHELRSEPKKIYNLLLRLLKSIFSFTKLLK